MSFIVEGVIPGREDAAGDLYRIEVGSEVERAPLLAGGPPVLGAIY